MEKFYGKVTSNSRIIIDYSKHKKQVDFSYPNKKTYWETVLVDNYNNIFFLLTKLNFIIIDFILVLILLYVYVFFELKIVSYILIYLFFFPLFVTILLASNKNLFLRFMPYCGYFYAKLNLLDKSKIFDLNHVKNKKCTIPYFGNLYLFYNANDDFSKYLIKIEIRELPEYLASKHNYKVNENEFYAIFYFSKKPLIGQLEVEYA